MIAVCRQTCKIGIRKFRESERNACKTECNRKFLADNFKVDISEKTTAKQLISTIVAKL